MAEDKGEEVIPSINALKQCTALLRTAQYTATQQANFFADIATGDPKLIACNRLECQLQSDNYAQVAMFLEEQIAVRVPNKKTKK